MNHLTKWFTRWPFLLSPETTDRYNNASIFEGPLAMVQRSSTPAAINRQFKISRAAPLTNDDMVHLIAQGLGLRIHRFNIPAQPVASLLNVTECLGITFQIKAKQLLPLNEEKVFSHGEVAEAPDVSHIAYEQGIHGKAALFLKRRDGLIV